MARGQVIPRGTDKWLLRVYSHRTAAGKRVYVSETFDGKHSQAQKHLTTMLRQKDTQTLTVASKETLEAFAERWIEAKVDVTPKTRLSYSDALRLRVLPHLGHLKLTSITPADVQRAVANATAGVTSTRHAFTILSGLFETAKLWGILIRNPCDTLILPRKVRAERKHFTKEQAQVLLSATKEDHYGPLWAFLLGTGCRPQEATALSRADVSLEGATASIHRVSRDREVVEDTKTEKSRRQISLPPFVIEAVRRQLIRQAKDRLRFGPNYQDSGLLFADKLGKPLHLKTLYFNFKRTCARHALPVIPFRNLRHTHATLLLSNGADISWVSKRLGHSDISITASVYADVTPEAERKMAEITERAVGL